MTRRNALDRLRQNAQDPISAIPLAQRRKRSNRSWDQIHRGASYFIPAALSEQAKELRASILALAQHHATSTSAVAAALIAFSLAHVHQGKLVLDARPNAHRRKMTLTWAEANGQPQNIPQPASRTMRNGTKYLYLNYRWDRDVDMEIKALSGQAISQGETIVFLLSYALAAHRSGRLILKEEPVVITQKLQPAW